MSWRSLSTSALAVAALCAAPRALDAQVSRRDHLVVSVDWMAQHLQEPGLVVLHVGPEEDYARGHIPGARYLPHSHREGPDGLVLELPPPEDFEASLEALGVSDHSRIVVYWSGDWVTPTTRLVFELDWAGLGDRTVLLDGGLGAWKAAGRPVTSEPAVVERGVLTLRPRRDLVVDAAYVGRLADRAQGASLVDGRARAFYDGVRDDRGRAGHIPGALSIPWTELIDESVRLRSDQELRAVFAAAGVRPGDTVVAYCHIGQYATTVLFAARVLGYEVRLYDGAFQDWARQNLPVETEPSR